MKRTSYRLAQVFGLALSIQRSVSTQDPDPKLLSSVGGK